MGYSDIKELLKDAKNFATGANDLQLKGVLLDIQDAVYELQEENRELRNEIQELNNTAIIDSELVFREGVYLKGNDIFCSACWDANKKLVRVRQHPAYNDREEDILFYCDVCNDYRYSDLSSTELSDNKLK